MGVATRTVMPIPMKKPLNEARLAANDTAPVSPTVVRRKKLAQVGQAVKSPMKLPSPPIHLTPATLGAFLYEYVAMAAFSPTSQDAVNISIRLIGTSKMARFCVRYRT